MKRQKRYPDTEIFHYLNLNPKGKVTCDCVVRAIAWACVCQTSRDFTEEKKVYTGKYLWNTVLDDLTDCSRKTGFMVTDTKCYTEYLKELYFTKHPQPRHLDGTKYTLAEFIAEHPKGIYLVNMPTHLTVVVDGVNYDIWDCTKTDKRIGNYWSRP